MPYEPRTIGLSCELVHPPVVLDAAPLQRIHNQQFEGTRGASGPGFARPLYAGFQVTPQGVVLSNAFPQPGAVSEVRFLGDRMQFREELSGVGPEDFARRVQVLAALAAEARRIPVYLAQVVTVRSLVNPRCYGDSRLFLRDGVFAFAEHLVPFGRDPQLLGLRLAFPATQEEPHGFALRIESWTQDPRSLFLEVQATFGPSTAQHGFDVAAENVARAYRFLSERALAFLERYDVRQEA